MPCKKTKIKGHEYTFWDNFIYKGDMKTTIDDLMKYFKTKYDYDIDLIAYDEYILYGSYQKQEIREQRKKSSIIEVTSQVTKKNINELSNPLKLSIVIENDNEAEADLPLPDVKFYY